MAFVEGLGINPNELARDLFEAEVRRLKANAWLEGVRKLKVRLGGNAADIVREDRDAR